MSDDSFFREVSEELRQDRVKAIWTRFGAYILVAVVLIVAVTAGLVGWDRYQASRAAASGDAYLAALQLAENDQPDQAIAALQQVAETGVGAYPDLARMSIGAVTEKAGKPAEAVAAFDRVAKDAEAPQPIRDMADIRAAYILVDSGTLDDVQSRVERLTGDSDPLRFPAREAIALAAWKAGDVDTARPLFQGLVGDAGTPNGIAGRARLMLAVIDADTPAPANAPSTDAAPSTAASEKSASQGASPSGAATAQPEPVQSPAEGEASGASSPTTEPGQAPGRAPEDVPGEPAPSTTAPETPASGEPADQTDPASAGPVTPSSGAGEQ